jgi:hypothetical protein
MNLHAQVLKGRHGGRCVFSLCRKSVFIYLFIYLFIFVKKYFKRPGLVTQVCNPSYFGSRDQDD